MLSAPAAPDETARIPNIAVIEIVKDHEQINDTGDYREVHWIEYAIKGSNGATVRDKASRLQKTNPVVWEAIGPVYERWLKGQEEPVDGTPLHAWPAVTKGQVEQLKFLHIRTVEDVAAMNDAAMQRFGMGARVLRDKAQAFIQAKEGEAVLAEQLSKRDAQIEELMARIEDLEKANASLAQGRKRGRPPKDAAGRSEV